MPDVKDAILEAISIAGGQEQVARELGVRQQSVSEWVQRGEVPPRRVRGLARLTQGRVTEEQLNPDVFY